LCSASGLRSFTTVLLAAAADGCRRHYPPDPAHDVDIVASDGVMLKASYFSPGKPGPGIVLFHQCNWDRHAWDTLTPDLVGAGFHVLTFDLRGFGDTPATGTSGRADERKSTSDAEAVYAYLLSKPDVDRSRLAAGGASCGVMYSAGLVRRGAYTPRDERTESHGANRTWPLTSSPASCAIVRSD
jgi:pimeloyl-ACP methyl ester carboxylesterase